MSNDEHRTRTPRPRALLGGGLAIAVAMAALIQLAPSARPRPAAAATSVPAASPAEPSLALDYRPGDEPGERRIAAAQRAARARPSAEAHAALALAMLERKRETADGAYLQYAIEALESARALDSAAAPVLVAESLVAHEAHRFGEAAALAERLVARSPDDPIGHLLLGDARLELGDYPAALGAYQRALDRRPDLRSYNRAAHLRWLHGDVEGALELLALAVEAGSPRHPESIAWCYVDLGEIHRKRGDGRRALAAARRARELVPDYHPALVLEAHARELVGEREAAIAAIERAVARHPRVADLLWASQLLARAGRHGEARLRFAQAERMAEDDPRPFALYLARHDREPARALALAERELAARRSIEAQDAHALALLRAGRAGEALGAIDRALALGTPDAELHLHRALVLAALGDRDGARAAAAAARALHPRPDPLLAAELRRALGEEP